ncbi:MAG: 3-hydroxyacyl-CoA dehydrogenase NAD-binding domain-containing protein [Actinomycetales bacterium]
MTGTDSPTELDRVLVVGAGAIGTSWAAHFLAFGLEVTLADPVTDTHGPAERRVLSYLTQIRPDQAEELLANLSLTGDAVAAATDTDLVVEAGPERLDLKRELFAALDEAAPARVLLTSSSSGLMPSQFSDACLRHPERVLIAHPFNPPHLVALVELVAAPSTSQQAMAAAEKVFAATGKRTIRVRKELPGHVVNRLQAALWREAYHLVAIGAASVSDIDTAIASGPGLRWALLGPFATQHLSGGGKGIAHVLDHLGPPMLDWWADLGDPELSPDLVAAIVAGTDEEIQGQDEDDLLRRRDAALVDLVELKRASGLD